MSAPTKTLEHCLGYVAHGWKVAPLWWVEWPDPLEPGVCACPKGQQCTSPGKHPLLPHGILEASSEEAQIREWLERWPSANVGLATGPASGIYVVDLDGPEAIAAWDELGLPNGWRSITGNGLHLIYSLDAALPNSAGKLGRGIDTRGTGGYIVAPPSLHRSGKRYAWEQGLRLAGSPPLLPAAIRERLTPSMETPPKPPQVRFGESTAYARGVLRHALERLAAAPKGEQNETATRESFLLGQWIGGGELSPAGVQEALEQAHPKPCDAKKVRSTVTRSLRDGVGYPRTKADE